MRSIGDDLQSFLTNKKNPTSERAHLIQTICDTLFSDKEFKKVLGQTKQFTVDEIRDIFDQARSWQVNPRALFWKLVKEKREAIRDQLEKAHSS